MLILTDAEVQARLDWPGVLDALDHLFRDPGAASAPERTVIDAPGGGALLAMPCVDADGWFGVKQVAVLPGNRAAGLPGVRAHYTLMDPQGAVALSAAATRLTRIRTAGASALAARRLAPERARTLLVCGTGGLAPVMASAHLAVRPYGRVTVWGRDPARAEATAAAVAADLDARRGGLAREVGPRPVVAPVEDLETAFLEADVVTAATGAAEPFLRGAWLERHEGAPHIDLVGAFSSAMAEADPDLVRRCRVVVDDRAAARAEAGDLIRAVREGAWSWNEAAGDLAALTQGEIDPRSDDADAPTLFKSVGVASEDLVVARLLLAADPA